MKAMLVRPLTSCSRRHARRQASQRRELIGRPAATPRSGWPSKISRNSELPNTSGTSLTMVTPHPRCWRSVICDLFSVKRRQHEHEQQSNQGSGPWLKESLCRTLFTRPLGSQNPGEFFLRKRIRYINHAKHFLWRSNRPINLYTDIKKHLLDPSVGAWVVPSVVNISVIGLV